jgi:hypothetical protein
LVLAMFVGVGALWIAPAESLGATSLPAASATAPVAATDPPTGVATGAASVTLLAQPAFLGAPKGVFRMRLRVTAPDPEHGELRVNVYSRLTTRTGFDEALGGQPGGFVIYPLTLDLSKLPADPAGGVDVDIPINEAARGLDVPTFYAAAGSGVFPVQVGVSDNSGNSQGQPLVTYLVYAEPYPASGLPKLSVSVVVPIQAAPVVDAKGQTGPPGANASGALAGLVSRLGRYPDVPISLSVTPQTLDSLAAGSTADRATLVDLAQLVQAGRSQVLPSTYVSVPMRGWDEVGLGEELHRQVLAGSSVLAGVFGSTPSSKTWAINGPIDAPALQYLQSGGTRQLILPDVELSALPAVARTTTFALPTHLLGSGPMTSVYAADAGLTADFSSSGGSVLAANHLLAELAMIQLETPGLTRGVVVLPPPGWSPDPVFLETLLAGLKANPLLDPVTASRLFKAVPVASVERSIAVPSPSTPASGETQVSTGPTAPASSASGGSTSTSGIAPTTVAPGLVADAAAQLGADADTIRTARQELSGLEAILPRAAQQAADLNRVLLTAESSDLNDATRQQLLGEVFTATNRVTRLITLPRASSITLTSTKAQLPLTVLSAPSLRARVELRLSSQRLIFRQAFPAEGKCRVPTPTSEVCDLTLTTQNTTVKIPVESRSSGVFPLDVSLWAPDGSQMLARNRDTIRSTAVSGVGIVLIIVAVVSLGLWWARDLRHGRRARQLVPAPSDDGDYHDDNEDSVVADDGLAGVGVPEDRAGGPADGLAGVAVPDDPNEAVRDFLSTPAPEYRERPSWPRS